MSQNKTPPRQNATQKERTGQNFTETKCHRIKYHLDKMSRRQHDKGDKIQLRQRVTQEKCHKTSLHNISFLTFRTFQSFANAIIHARIFRSDKIDFSRHLVEDILYGSQQELGNVEVNISLVYRIYIDLFVKTADVFQRSHMLCTKTFAFTCNAFIHQQLLS